MFKGKCTRCLFDFFVKHPFGLVNIDMYREYTIIEKA